MFKIGIRYGLSLAFYSFTPYFRIFKIRSILYPPTQILKFQRYVSLGVLPATEIKYLLREEKNIQQ
jgi:hypothetical protein